jgi:hypothetical protein
LKGIIPNKDDTIRVGDKNNYLQREGVIEIEICHVQVGSSGRRDERYRGRREGRFSLERARATLCYGRICLEIGRCIFRGEVVPVWVP